MNRCACDRLGVSPPCSPMLILRTAVVSLDFSPMRLNVKLFQRCTCVHSLFDSAPKRPRASFRCVVALKRKPIYFTYSYFDCRQKVSSNSTHKSHGHRIYLVSLLTHPQCLVASNYIQICPCTHRNIHDLFNLCWCCAYTHTACEICNGAL